MITTPNAAGDLWCPFVRQTWARPDEKIGWRSFGHPPFNMARISGSDEEYRAPCISQRCMAWRWAGRVMLPEAEGSSTQVPTLVGYCGMAGQPLTAERSTEVLDFQTIDPAEPPNRDHAD